MVLQWNLLILDDTVARLAQLDKCQPYAKPEVVGSNPG